MSFITEFMDDGAVILYGDRTTGTDILNAKAEFFAHAFPSAPRFLLCDFTHVEKFDVATADVTKIVRQDLGAVESHPGLAEVVIAPEPHQFGLARMWEIQVSDERITHVARTRQDALDWLSARGIDLKGLRNSLHG